MRRLATFARDLLLLLISPVLVLVAATAIALGDLVCLFTKKRAPGEERDPDTSAASVVIPNWNGKDLLEKYLPSVIEALEGNPRNEIIVVENGSTDGSREMLLEKFPQVKVLVLEKNAGFGGGSNAGFRAAKNDIVVLLNSDMRVAEDFLPPLLEGFAGGGVFAVSCQIFFSDPAKVREETGLTQAWWESGALRVRHRADEKIESLYPCFYGGGGSCAFDRRKFLELGGFDEVFRPFYLEDTDLGFQAWKRGWKVLYQPRSVVWHEHRGTIGRMHKPGRIEAVLRQNFILFVWKNIHAWPWLISNFGYTWASALVSMFLGDAPERASFAGLWGAFLRLPRALRSRARARSLALIPDAEAFRRPMGGCFRDTFHVLPADPARLSVLFLSPYPVCPPIHGGGVFMYQTLCELGKLADVHLLVLLDKPEEMPAHAALDGICASQEFFVRPQSQPKKIGSIVPSAVREFADEDLAWLIHREILLREVDVLQLEYTNMGQYAGGFRRIPSILFEHDVYFQSISRGLSSMRGVLQKTAAVFEYLRALRYELRILKRQDRIQFCSKENGDFVAGFLPELAPRMDYGMRAGIDTNRYEFRLAGRQPDTLLFLGSFRHLPNAGALNWFVRDVYPRILAARPSARLIVVGSDPPARHSLPDLPNIELRGFVEDIREPLGQYAVFICPILSGSGVRVKLLEAFSAGIPVVSTRIGAEGLATEDGQVCALADDAAEFAGRTLRLLNDPAWAAELATRARELVVADWDMAVLTRRLEESYRQAVREMRSCGIER